MGSPRCWHRRWPITRPRRVASTVGWFAARALPADSLGAGLCRAVGAARPPRTGRAPRGGGGGDRCDVAALASSRWRSWWMTCTRSRPGSAAEGLLAAVVTALPANGHLVLAGRRSPDLTLARLELEGHVVRLGEADLAFTPDEVARFAALRGVPEARLAACGGWPALAELSAARRVGRHRRLPGSGGPGSAGPCGAAGSGGVGPSGAV